MKTKTTIADIAAKLGISAATVSRALKDSSSISEGMKERVWEEAKKMGYGRNPTLEEPKIIVVVVPELFNYFYSEIIHCIEQTIDQRNYQLSIYCSYNSFVKEKAIVEQLSMNETCCLILSRAMDTTDSNHLIRIKERGIPLIQLNRVDFEVESPKFIIDNYMDLYATTKKLILAGYTRIAFAAKHYNCSIYQEREQGYRDALVDQGIEFNPRLLLHSELTQEDISEVITHFLDSNPRPDAVLLPNYYAVLQAIYLAKIRNIKVPEELGLFSLDEEIYAKFNTPSVSSIERPLQRIGEDIGELVNKIIEKKEYEKNKVTIYASTIIIRGSTLV